MEDPALGSSRMKRFPGPGFAVPCSFHKHLTLPPSIKMKTFFCRDLISELRAWPLREAKLPLLLNLTQCSFMLSRQACIPLNAPGIAYSH